MNVNSHRACGGVDRHAVVSQTAFRGVACSIASNSHAAAAVFIGVAAGKSYRAVRPFIEVLIDRGINILLRVGDIKSGRESQNDFSAGNNLRS